MTTRTFVGGAGDTWGATPGGADADWSAAFTPSATEDAVVNGSSPSPIDATSVTMEVLSLNFTGFAGTWDVTGSTLHTYGNLTLTAGMTITGAFALHPEASFTLTSAGHAVNSGSSEAGNVMTLADDFRLEHNDFNIAGIAAGANKVYVTMTGSEDAGLYVTESFTWSAGAEFIASSDDAAGYVELRASGSGETVSLTLPPFSFTGPGALYPNTAVPIKAQTQTWLNGSAWFDNVGYESVSDFSITNMLLTIDGIDDDMGGLEITVGGDLDVTDTNLNNGVFSVTGLAVHHGGTKKTITDCDFSGGEPLYADGCIDGTGNVNVLFEAPPGGGPDLSSNSSSIGAGAGF